MRIVSLSPSSTEILFALGAGEDVVGVTQLCDFPTEALRRQRLGTWLQTQPAVIAELRPDLIVTTTFLPPELRTYVGPGEVLHLEPTSLGSVFETILQVGRATGRTETGEGLVRCMQQNLETLRARAPQNRLRVYCEACFDPATQAGNWVPELIEIAGGIPVGGQHTRPSAPIGVDALHAADPDLLVFHWCEPEPKRNFEFIRQRTGWQTLRAVQTGSCAFIPGDLLNRPGPRLVDGARKLQEALYTHQRAA